MATMGGTAAAASSGASAISSSERASVTSARVPSEMSSVASATVVGDCVGDIGDGVVSDGAGDVGFFSPGSYWPLGVAAAAALTAIGLAFWYPWLVTVGATLVLIAVGGLVFEYHRGVAHH